MNLLPSHPILSCHEARQCEDRLFGGEEEREWPAMQRAGQAIAAAVGRDLREVGGMRADGRVLVLAGKGHNGGDALIAARAMLADFPAARAEVLFAFGSRRLRPLAARAWRELAQAAGPRVREIDAPTGAYDLSLDGIFGFQFRPPVEARVEQLIARANATPVRMRVAVDLPSAGLFQADFTYATGIMKAPALEGRTGGRLRYLDLGFFSPPADGGARDRVLLPEVLAPLRGWRAPGADKRSFGHLFIVGGSGHFPGAVLMSVLPALRSGVGLVTAFVPEPLVPVFAARAPEAMWVGWPQTPGGGLALEGEHLLRERFERATALLIGPGLGREPETLALARSVVEHAPVPLVIDADALQPDIVGAGRAPRVLTPHAGELARIGGRAGQRGGPVLVEKGPLTRIVDGSVVYHSCQGGPVLARGGSGDVLGGLIGGLLAQTPGDPLLAAARGVMWQGLAADALAREHGPVAVSTTQLLDFLPVALREA